MGSAHQRNVLPIVMSTEAERLVMMELEPDTLRAALAIGTHERALFLVACRDDPSDSSSPRPDESAIMRRSTIETLESRSTG